MLLSLAVALAAVGAACWIVGEHRLQAPLRLLGGAIAGLTLGPLVLVVAGRARRGRVVAVALAVLAALALTVPAVLAHRVGTLDGVEPAGLAPLGADDQVVSVAGTDEPSAILVRRAAGASQLVADDGMAVTDLATAAGDVAALSADGRYVTVAHAGSTQVASASDPARSRTVVGTPVGLVGDVLVVRVCADERCDERGYDLRGTGPLDEPTWTVDVDVDAPVADAEGAALTIGGPAPSAADVGRQAGVLPDAVVRRAAGQGWAWVDPATGHLHGRVIAPDDGSCRVVAPASLDDDGAVPPVVAVCAAADGALTASASRDGAPLWTSDASAPGDWTVRIDGGRVIADGTQSESGTAGEIVATEHDAAWSEPGGETVAEAGPYRAQVGVDGMDVVRVTAAGQAIAHDIATGETVWAEPVSEQGGPLRGALGARTAVLLDTEARTDALDPRAATRLRVIDSATGEVTVDGWSPHPVQDVRPVSAGRALVLVDDRMLLVGV